jgi:hypothetical protein
MNRKHITRFFVAMLLVSAVTLSLFALPPIRGATYTNMQDGGSLLLPSGVTPDYTLDTEAHLALNPNPVGVGQPVTVLLWLAPPTHVSRFFNNYDVIITDPDGTSKTYTKASYYADATSWMQFTPDKIGTWTIEFQFKGGYFPAGNYTVFAGSFLGAQVVSFPNSMYYKPSHDGPYNLTVQQEEIQQYPGSSLPTEYWSRPVQSDNREWASIMGWYPSTGVVGQKGVNWPADTNTYMSSYRYLPYIQAPNSAHILWKQQTSIGGLIGGPAGDLSWSSGVPNNGVLPSIIYAGRCYGSMRTMVNGIPTNVWQCSDLRTGEIYWEQPGVPVPQWVIYEKGFAATPGADPQYARAVYLATISAGRLIKYDPYSGAVAQNVSISPMTSGEYYANTDWAYFYSVQTIGSGASAMYRLINWTVHGDIGASSQQVNIGLRVISNITWPFSSLGTPDYESDISCQVVSPLNVGMGANIDANITAVRISTGQILWSKMAGVPYNVWPSETLADHGKLSIRFENGRIYCWDLQSGQQLWTSEVSSWPWGMFGAYGTSSYGGNIIVGQYDGVAAYDWVTGKVSWLYRATAQYPYESNYQGSYPFFSGSPWIADGKVFYCNSEHTPTQPLTRGWALHCINATNGQGIWNLTMGAIMSTPVAIADGYVVASNAYDGMMYVIGKGQSVTTVTAPDKALTLGDSLIIKGTVTDKSSAQPGTAAVSDESMSTWMEYLNMQAPMPTDIKGVNVRLDVIDANGNYRNIGTTTTDASGTYSFMWTPDISGKYTVKAIFEGTESYGSSWAETAFGVVDSSASTTPAPTVQQQTATEMYFLPAVAAIIVVIIIGFVVMALLLLRRRP